MCWPMICLCDDLYLLADWGGGKALLVGILHIQCTNYGTIYSITLCIYNVMYIGMVLCVRMC